MVAIVLPLREVVREVMQYDHLFNFYGGGVRDLIAYHVQCSAAWSDHRERKDMEDELLHKVWLDYNQYLENNKENRQALEYEVAYIFKRLAFINELISRRVAGIMASIMGNVCYEVNQHWHDWMDNDLIVGVDSWYG